MSDAWIDPRGRSVPVVARYRCPECRETRQAESAPECRRCRVRMGVVK